MSHETTAVYVHGTLQLDKPLPIAEHQRVKVIVQVQESRVRRAYGLLPWPGDAKELEDMVLNPEHSIEESE